MLGKDFLWVTLDKDIALNQMMFLKRLFAAPRRLQAAHGLRVAAEPFTLACPCAVACILPMPQQPQLLPVLRVRGIALTGARAREPPRRRLQQHAPPLRTPPKAGGGSNFGATLRRGGFLPGVAAARLQAPSPNVPM